MSGVDDGLFGLAYKLRDDSGVEEKDRDSLKQPLSWLEGNLPTPERFNRSKSKGYYRRNTNRLVSGYGD
jgi:hypothetical protein